ncbi:YggS family pyridoxal phosphate-dependent enzyme [Heliorestis acidaminivorans]|uniref:Pyridoxal phosphate homeostasis protein n=1 Tax=Heliorestis acidaminivorans TaxID=553427 RepID=A0A6I0F3C0_9FIRM|nr:YggS family pyridoxal phosphate-dependent enzyme [Heliorestis acidaminivorans]KAB2954501.1 YggS family pyridoxal phosphate-dependent enzyme [Heliorestis acidaminivorans]
MGHVEQNLNRVRQKIKASADKAGRNIDDITLVAVTKNVAIADIEAAVASGVTTLGENRVQEFMKKIDQLQNPPVRWHMIGTLQSNKVKYIYDKVELIHSLDRLSLAKEIQKYARYLGRPISCLVEVNVAQEESKEGLQIDEVPAFLKQLTELEGLTVQGLMTMAPYTENPEEVRWVFRKLRELSLELAELKLEGVAMRELSMGMSNDLEVAVEEGATLVRVGTAIFGGN